MYEGMIAGGNRPTVESNQKDIHFLWDIVNGLVEANKPAIKEEPKMKDDDWKDLDIKCIPGDFFVNENIEVEAHSIVNKTRGWILLDTNLISRPEIIINMNRGTYKYRYRLKPLESMKFSKKFKEWVDRVIAMDIIDSSALNYKAIGSDDFIDGHKVEII